MDAPHYRAAPGLAAPEPSHHDVVGTSPIGTAARRAAMTPASDTTPVTPHVEGPEQTEARCLELEQTVDKGDRVAALCAYLALKGCGLGRTAANAGFACLHDNRSAMARMLRDLAALAQFLIRVGGAHA